LLGRSSSNLSAEQLERLAAMIEAAKKGGRK